MSNSDYVRRMNIDLCLSKFTSYSQDLIYIAMAAKCRFLLFPCTYWTTAITEMTSVENPYLLKQLAISPVIMGYQINKQYFLSTSQRRFGLRLYWKVVHGLPENRHELV